MLLYVDKKKEKRRKIKIFCTVAFILFAIYANINQFKTTLNRTKSPLSAYSYNKEISDWYKNTDTIIVFSKKSTDSEKIILLPKDFTKETAQTLAYIFSKQKTSALLSYTEDVDFSKEINTLSSIFFNNASKSSSHQNILITTKLENITAEINKHQLTPTVFNYKNNLKIKNTSKYIKTMAKLFPPVPEPQDELEKQTQALYFFIKNNKQTLSNLILNHQSPSFREHYLFLKQARACLETKQQFLCNTQNKTSLEKVIAEIKPKLLKTETPQKLVLLTTDKPIQEEELEHLPNDTGIHFKFYNKEAFLWPSEHKKLNKKQKINYILKQKAGINPEYTAPDMKFYKFKTAEVTLND